MVSAPEYVECLMNWIETQIDNEIIFPKNPGICEANYIFKHPLVGFNL